MDNRFIIHVREDNIDFATDNEMCPLSALISYLDKRKELSNKSGALFINSQGLPLSHKYFIQLLKLLLQRLGFNDKLYNGHGIKKGAESICGRLMVEDSLIRELGRWNSDTFNVYIKTDIQSIRKAHLAMSRDVPIYEVNK